MPPSFEALIHAVLDGEASAEQRAELDRRMQSDPALRAKYEEMQRVFAILEEVPAVEPPAGLVESILQRAPLHPGRPQASHQPFARTNVFAAYPGDAKAIAPGRSTIGNWFSALVHFLKEIGMNEQKPGFLGTNRGKLLVTAGVAAIALVGISTVIDFPSGGTSTSGAIVPAERHRAPQNAAQDINVAIPGTAAQSSGTPVDAATGAAAGQAEMKAGVAASKVAASADLMHQSRADAKAAGVAAGNAEAKAAAVAADNANMKAGAVAADNANARAAAVAASNAEARAAAVAAANANAKAAAVAANNAEARAAAVAAAKAGASADAKANLRQ